VDPDTCLPGTAVMLSCAAKTSVLIHEYSNSVCTADEIATPQVVDFCHQSAASVSSKAEVSSGTFRMLTYKTGDCSGPATAESLTCGSCSDVDGDGTFSIASCIRDTKSANEGTNHLFGHTDAAEPMQRLSAGLLLLVVGLLTM